MDLARFMGLQDVSGVRCIRRPNEDDCGASGSRRRSPVAEEGDLNTALVTHALPISAVAPQKRKAPARPQGPARKKRVSNKEAADQDLSTFEPIGTHVQQEGPSLIDEESSDDDAEDEALLKRARGPSSSAAGATGRAESSGAAPVDTVVLDDDSQSTPPHTTPEQSAHGVMRIDNLDAHLRVSVGTSMRQFSFLQGLVPSDLRNQIGSLSVREAQRARTQMSVLNLAFACDELERTASSEGFLRNAASRVNEEKSRADALQSRVRSLEEELRAANDARTKAEAAHQEAEAAREAAVAASAVATADKDAALAEMQAVVADKTALAQANQALNVSLEHVQDELAEAQQTISAQRIAWDQAAKDPDEAEMDFTHLQQGLPQLAANILKSEAVTNAFGEVLVVSREAERLTTLKLIASQVPLPDPLPEAIRSQIDFNVEDRLASAAAQIMALEIPSLVAISQDASLSASSILSAEL